MSEEMKLLPCPWCGSQPVTGVRFDWGHVKCPSESCSVKPQIRRKDDASQSGCAIAIAAWNRRAKTTTVQIPHRFSVGDSGWYIHPTGRWINFDEMTEVLRAAGITVKERP